MKTSQGSVPIISISTNESLVLEGSDAVFEVSADKTIAEDLFVNYTVREYQTDFILPEVARVGIVSLNAGTSSQTGVIIIQTVNDLVDETNGKIEVQLENEQISTRTYQVSSPQGNAAVIIEDDDLPVIASLNN